MTLYVLHKCRLVDNIWMLRTEMGFLSTSSPLEAVLRVHELFRWDFDGQTFGQKIVEEFSVSVPSVKKKISVSRLLRELMPEDIAMYFQTESDSLTSAVALTEKCVSEIEKFHHEQQGSVKATTDVAIIHLRWRLASFSLLQALSKLAIQVTTEPRGSTSETHGRKRAMALFASMVEYCPEEERYSSELYAAAKRLSMKMLNVPIGSEMVPANFVTSSSRSKILIRKKNY